MFGNVWNRRQESRFAAANRGSRRLQFEQLEIRQVLAANVYITELLASNSNSIKDGDGDSSDWIELFNNGATAADVSGYYLTDKSSDLTQWAFPGGTIIAPKSTIIVFASDKAAAHPPGELHTNFKLSADGEYLALVEPNGTTIVQQFAPKTPSQQTDISYGLSMSSSSTTLVDDTTPMRYLAPVNNSADAVWRMTAYNDSAWSLGTAGIGYEASPGSANEFTSLIDVAVPSTTTTAYTRFTFNVANPGSFKTLNLGMIYDDGFVAYLNGTLIASSNAPGSLAYNSIATGQRGDEVVLAGYVNFDVSNKLSELKQGANVLAIHALNQSGSSDMLMIPKLTGGIAEVVTPIVAGYFQTPTPGAANGQIFTGIVEDTAFSVDRGFYSTPFNLEISTPTAGAKIVYTINGSAPAVDANLNIINGFLYTGSLLINKTSNIRAAAYKLGYAPTNIDTQTYIFTSDVIHQTQQSALAAGFPGTWGSRAADYGMDPDVIGPNDLFGGVYAALIEDSLKAIPTLSLTLDNADFFGPNGIYSNVGGEGVAWERPTSAELIYADGTEGFQIDAGLRIHGAASRSLSKKNALRLLFKDEYGAGKLEYPLFGEEGVTKFDTIVIRPHFNDGWGWDGALGDPLYARDQWFRDTQAAMGNASARGNVVHLYINGLYWGLYNPSERPDDSFAAETFGGEKEEYDVVNHDGLADGSIDAYNAMIALAQAVNAASGTAAKNAAYQNLQGNFASGLDNPSQEDYLDVANYIDYMILNHYGGNNDWPDRNWYANRRRGPESEGFKFFAWDNEISLDLSDRTSINENNLGMSTGAAQAYGILRNYEEFRLQFADRIHEHLFNGGALYVNPASPTYDPNNPQNNVPAARMAELAARVYDAMPAESARWGDQHVTVPRTRDVEWQNQLNYMLGTYFRDRHGIVLNQWKAASLYPNAVAPEFLVNNLRQHGGTIAAGGILSVQNGNTGSPGTIYYTTDGSDPRLVGGAVNAASAQVFSGNIPLSSATLVKARILRNGEWSALTAATFTPVAASADFNSDGIVDGGDFLAWQRGYGLGSTRAQGNADGDSDVDQDDLVVWKTQFGQTTGTPASPMSVAAPASLNSYVTDASFMSPSSLEVADGALVIAAATSSTPALNQVSAILQSRAWNADIAARQTQDVAHHSARDAAFNDDVRTHAVNHRHESVLSSHSQGASSKLFKDVEESSASERDEAKLAALSDFLLTGIAPKL
ncbi:CotH kinase family protein [Lacipirellula parvula]|uniref:LTD domain-containing protein n=1 Tax=Lacipirellula parvula TaxID=2650471 RepID=A0A5K7XHZ1_9BACT|nr:CotH kinase family protein [Lacipirellula parvula]BBO33823.1 hypothetical protein PLANPX_3435 [Lacipirellula parvula]